MSTAVPRSRRRWLWWLLAVAFVVVPLAEVYLLVQLGQVIGAWWTILVLVAAGVLGSILVRREGGRTWQALQSALSAHRMPATELADGALVLIGGTLLLTPGFLTDAVGLFCILPFTRPLARRVLARVLARRLARHPATTSPLGPFFGPGAGAGNGSGNGWGTGSRRDRAKRDVVPGEVVDDDRR